MKSEQLTLVEIVPHEIENEIVEQRIGDGYINATAMCKAAGKKFAHYAELKTTVAFLSELSSDIGIPISKLVQSIRGGKAQGTWVHPQVAIHLAQWLSPRFAVRVSQWVYDWLSGKTQGPRFPYHIRRYMANMERIPNGYFSILNEMTFGLIAPLERYGYSLPEHMLPDISEGKMFNRYLREELGLQPDKFPSYDHYYEDGRCVPARLYPDEILHVFRGHLHGIWIPNRAIDYFRERDPEAIQHLEVLIALNSKRDDKALF